jgi:hypothetical protein
VVVLDGAGSQPLALGEARTLRRTSRPSCAATSTPSRPWAERRPRSSTTA